jgi:NAD(P)-dependent dehydrogenase (short-subunit alcohol dehydrogenase family)
MQSNDYVLITGSTSGIGHSIVLKLSREYNLILHGRNESELIRLRQLVPKYCDTRIFIADLNEITTLGIDFKLFLEKEKIQVRGFIHCAGFVRILPIKHFKFEYTQQIFNINFFSAIEIIKVLLSLVNSKKLNNVIFISALFSKRGDKGNSVYASSKGAIDTFVKSMALELSPKVRINSVLPGAIETKMTAELFKDKEFRSKIENEYPLGLGQVDDISNMVEFLLSDNSKWITGQNYLVDGGRSCN